MSDLEEIFQKIIKQMDRKQKKVQVARVPAEHLLDFKKGCQARDKRHLQMELLISKIKALKAQNEVKHNEFWSWLTDICTLPSDQHYECDRTGIVLKIIDEDAE